MVENVITEYIHQILLIHSPIIGFLVWLLNLTPVHSAAVNTGTQVSLTFLIGFIQANRKV